MIAAAFILLSVGWLGLYAGFTNTDPRAEISAALQGMHASRGSVSVASSDTTQAKKTLNNHVKTVAEGTRA